MNDAPPAPTDWPSLGAYIRAARETEGLSRTQLAGKVGVTSDAVAAWENDTRCPSPRAMHFLTEALPALAPGQLLALAPADGRGRR